MSYVGKFALALFVLSVLNDTGANSVSLALPDRSKGRVLGGIEADPGSAPYMVALIAKRFLGAGVIINRLYVLTTKAVVPTDNFYALVGVHDIASGEFDQRIPVDRVIRHIRDDVALVRLGFAIFFNQMVTPAVLPQRGHVHAGDVTLYGWGSQSKAYGVLNKAVLDIVDIDRCFLIFGGPGVSPLTNRDMCTGPLTGGIAPCTGDAGSPIVQENAAKEIEVVGLVSWGFIPCGGVGNPQVHIRVSAYVDWIVENLY